MTYQNLQECVADLEKKKQLIRINSEVDANLEVGAIQRRVYQAGGPALLFTRVKGCQFPMLGNLFGTIERTHYLFRNTLDVVAQMIQLKVDPYDLLKHPIRYRKVHRVAFHFRPKKVSRGPILEYQTTIDQLPQLKSWSKDGGAFVTLPQVYTEHPQYPGFKRSNLGMYRVQLSGNEYQPNKEVGLHYQLHRGIGIHHTEALRLGKPFRVNIFVGGPPAMTLAAVMPLPETISELGFAGVLGGGRIPMIVRRGKLPIHAEADFCICGVIDPKRNLPEGPFGDHLGYYSLKHDHPVLKVEKVFHREGAIWPFTTVGRPPQEDTCFGDLIHRITGPLVPFVLPGVHAVHAVDTAGVHPLLLAIGSERYTPFHQADRPQEILTQANAILGQGQLSLSKYLFISSYADNPNLKINDISGFFQHILERVDWSRDLHFQTQTTIDTLDYTGHGLNQGSKLVTAAAGSKKRNLPTKLCADLKLPNGFKNPMVVLPGVLAIQGPKVNQKNGGVRRFCEFYREQDGINQFPLLVIVDDSEFTARTLDNFLWVTFTRSNPASDVDGIGGHIQDKHWGCAGSLVIDARMKPGYPEVLEVDPKVEKRVDALGASGGPLCGVI